MATNSAGASVGGGSGSAAGGGTGVAGGGASKAFLIVAVVLGVLATVLAFAFIENSAGADRGPRMRIVVAAHDLRPNAAIDPERDLKPEDIPVKFSALAAQSLDWEARGNYKGQRVNRRILAGQPVFLADIAAMADFELKGGQRALTIPAETGIIIPGDYVKIMVPRMELGMAPATADGGRGTPASQTQVTLIGKGNGYRVLAVGGSLFKTRQQVTASEQFEAGGGNARTVTLEVTESEAQEIQRALGTGQQRVVLLLCPAPETAATRAANAP